MQKLILFTMILLGSLTIFADDATIKSCVIDHLGKAKSLAGEAITVAVTDQVGQVKDARKKATAARVAKAKACGAVAVKNELTTTEPSANRKAKQ